MIPGNRPEDEYFERFIDGIDGDVGSVPLMAPEKLSTLVNSLVNTLRVAFDNGFAMGKQEAQMGLAEKEAERYERDLGKWEEARYNSAALGECLDKIESWYKALDDQNIPDGELLSALQDESLELLKKFHGDYYEERDE